jgi:hypothetical protein
MKSQSLPASAPIPRFDWFNLGTAWHLIGQRPICFTILQITPVGPPTVHPPDSRRLNANKGVRKYPLEAFNPRKTVLQVQHASE